MIRMIKDKFVGIRMPKDFKKILEKKAKKENKRLSNYLFEMICEEAGYRLIPEHIEKK